ncbi:MAG: phosphoglycerate dehydrogenase [Candidatus Omnitrophota bacterium]
MMKKVFIATTTFGNDDPTILSLLIKEGVEYTLNPFERRLNETEIKDVLSKGIYDGLLAGLEPLTKDVLFQAKGLKVISRVGVGLDNVDQSAAGARNILIFNTPGVLTDAVAELTLGLMLAALRKVSFLDRKMHTGQWEKVSGALLKGKLVGLIGFGHIGQRVATLVKAFGAEVLFFDVCKTNSLDAQQVELEQLIRTADIISLHSSGKECLIEANEISQMKQGVIIVNTARGILIDEGALAQGLSSGKVGCAALDVFTQEPYQGPLLKFDNVIMTPHIGSSAKEARIMMEKMAVENLLKGLKG